MRSTTFLGLVLVSAVGVACGGASSTGLFDGPSGAGDFDAGVLDSGAPLHGGDATTGTPDAGGNGQDAGGGGTLDAGAEPDTSIVVDAAPPPVDASPPPPSNPGVYCGDTNGNPSYCKVGTACCVKSGNGIPGGGSGSSCQTTTAPFCTGVTVECDSDDDCNGQICCGTLVNNSRYTSVKCSAVCDTQNDTQVHFCDLNAAVDVCAADGMQCTASTLLPGYARCS